MPSVGPGETSPPGEAFGRLRGWEDRVPVESPFKTREELQSYLDVAFGSTEQPPNQKP